MSFDLDKQYAMYKQDDIRPFNTIDGIVISRLFPRIGILILILFLTFVAIMFVPWVQTSTGNGQITALHPEDRVQQIVATVGGRVNKWFVRDGSCVKKGAKIAEIVDVDQFLLSRLSSEVGALQERLSSTAEATKLALSNLNRQQNLYKSGLTSKREFELTQINYQKSLADQQYYKLQLIKAQSLLSRQSSQLIVADRDGIVINTLASSGSKVVKSGDVLATFLPATDNIAVEIYISGNDVPLVSPKRKVRLVFDGWPSIQFSGWPSVSIGTFGGVVKVVDYASGANGMFRVLIEPDTKEPSWPSKNFLRMGARVQAYIQLNKVLLGYELWRELNGFPIAINNKNNNTTLNSNSIFNDDYDKKKGGGKYDK